MNNIKSKTSKSLFWRSVEKFLVNGSQFVISLVLARLLLPSDYGTIALLTIFIALSQVLIEGGFSQVIIQKQAEFNLQMQQNSD
ncbi:oligosaccharide flippase family protein [Bacteroides ovatus]|uniref:oligosaccharide flippase family protein n=1 Tax=Bacteroides ovatus TaxID=28116 RepID=UPI003DA5EB47